MLLIDYEIGFARLADPENVRVSLMTEMEFSFELGSIYGALIAGDRQVKAIDDYQKAHDYAIYYQFYNPWKVPFSQRIPLSRYERPEGELSLGTRVIPVSKVHKVLEKLDKNSKPKLSDFRSACGGGEHSYGWRLEFFIADLLLHCQEGTLFEKESEVFPLFNRRSGAIAAAISINIELPE